MQHGNQVVRERVKRESWNKKRDAATRGERLTGVLLLYN